MRGRRPAPDLHDLPPGPVTGGARRADAAPARRAVDAEIARAFLVSEGTVAQRIVRAKRTLAEARVPFEVPGRDELGRAPVGRARGDLPRLQRGLRGDGRRALDPPGAVRGRAAPGPHPRRADAARARGARAAGADGAAGLAAARAGRAGRRAGAARRSGPRALGPPARAARAGRAAAGRGAQPARSGRTRCRPRSPPATRGPAASRTPTGRGSSRSTTGWRRSPARPVVELNRAVAVAMAFGPEAGLELVDALADEPALRGYHLLPSVRGDLLERLGRDAEARGRVRARGRAVRQRARARAAPGAGRSAVAR